MVNTIDQRPLKIRSVVFDAGEDDFRRGNRYSLADQRHPRENSPARTTSNDSSSVWTVR